MKKGFFVVNVLDGPYYDDCCITGSINIPLSDMGNILAMIDKSSEIVVYCASYKCTASVDARKKLLAMGYDKVYLYEGGMVEWLQRGFPVAGACSKDYLKEVVEKPDRKKEQYELTAVELKEKMDAQKK